LRTSLLLSPEARTLHPDLVAIGKGVSSQAVGVALPVPRGFQNAFGQQGLGDGGLAGRQTGPSFI
jgi:hypothetical protein